MRTIVPDLDPRRRIHRDADGNRTFVMGSKGDQVITKARLYEGEHADVFAGGYAIVWDDGASADVYDGGMAIVYRNTQVIVHEGGYALLVWGSTPIVHSGGTIAIGWDTWDERLLYAGTPPALPGGHSWARPILHPESRLIRPDQLNAEFRERAAVNIWNDGELITPPEYTADDRLVPFQHPSRCCSRY